MEQTTPSFAGFANTFLVENGSDGQPTLKVVGPAEDISRRKRPHRKSRLGCIRCKKRKVKCDEAYPCGNCVKRNETCVRHRPPPVFVSGQSSIPSPETPTPRKITTSQPFSSSSGSGNGYINLLHMELLHHFERFTIPTLCFQEIWPAMLQLAFHSHQHTYLVNAILSLAAAHKAYLVPDDPRYHQANYILLDKCLRAYRKALSHTITATNCDALLGTAILVHHLMWCDLSFMEPVSQQQHHGLDLSADRLYRLSTGVRQIFFMAWPLFQTARSVFMRVPVLQPCMALENNVDSRGMNWQRTAQGFVDLYDNPRYCGGREAFSPAYSPFSSRTVARSPTVGGLSLEQSVSVGFGSSASAQEDTPAPLGTDSLDGNLFKVATLWDSYKMGEIFVENAGQQDKLLERAAYERLVVRLAVAIAFI